MRINVLTCHFTFIIRTVNKVQKNKNKNKKLLQSERKRVGNASISNLSINNKHLFSLSPINIFSMMP